MARFICSFQIDLAWVCQINLATCEILNINTCSESMHLFCITSVPNCSPTCSILEFMFCFITDVVFCVVCRSMMARVLMPVKRQSKKKCMKQIKKTGNNRTARSSGNVSKHNKNQRINRWHVDHMKGALEEYHNTGGNVLVRQLAQAWNVPHSMLQHLIDSKVKGSEHMSGRKPLFNSKTEEDLVSVIKLLAERGFPHCSTAPSLVGIKQECFHYIWTDRQMHSYMACTGHTLQI